MTTCTCVCTCQKKPKSKYDELMETINDFAIERRIEDGGQLNNRFGAMLANFKWMLNTTKMTEKGTSFARWVQDTVRRSKVGAMEDTIYFGHKWKGKLQPVLRDIIKEIEMEV